MAKKIRHLPLPGFSFFRSLLFIDKGVVVFYTYGEQMNMNGLRKGAVAVCPC